MSLADIRTQKFCLVYCGDRCDCQSGVTEMGEVIQLRDFQNPKDIERMQRELEKEAAAILAEAVPGQFTAPDKDPA